jgi:hypothetical protein
VDLAINHEQNVITGGANFSTVGMKFDWSTEQVSMKGASGHNLVEYTVNWKKGLLKGNFNNSDVRLEFDMGEGENDSTRVYVKGYANNAPVELTFDKISGHLGGGMNHGPVDITLVNCDLYDFLQHFFLFLR